MVGNAVSFARMRDPARRATDATYTRLLIGGGLTQDMSSALGEVDDDPSVRQVMDGTQH